jgi:putative ATP-dependent endonuclease of OLD family
MRPPNPNANEDTTFQSSVLTHLQVQNYRCLENVEVPLSPLTAIVGPNGVGKTTILRAIELVLGEAWPSLRSFRVPQDFTDFNASRELQLKVSFDPPYQHSDTHSTVHQVTAVRVTCKPYKRSGKWGESGDLHVDVEPLNKGGEVPFVALGQPTKGQKTQFGPLRVGTDIRDHARVLFIDHRRTLSQHLPTMRGSILGRLLQTARKEFNAEADFKKTYDAAMELLRTEQVRNIEDTVAGTAKRMLGFLGRDVTQSVEIGFGFADPANPFNSLRLQYREAGFAVPGEELGLGIQSAMVVGLFEAFRQFGSSIGTIVIEEPEMYLHPQAQRYFYRLLCEMTESGQSQVVYSTHSPIFADVNRFEALRLMRREPGSSAKVSYVAQDRIPRLATARDSFKIGGRFDTARNEVLFARRALLVEGGYGDRVAALMIAEKLGLDVDGEAIAVVDCDGKAGIELVVGVCRALDIPLVVLHDEDVWPIDQPGIVKKESRQRTVEQENEEARRMNQRIRAAVAKDSCLFLLTPSLEAVLAIGRNASEKPRRIAEVLQGIDITNSPEELRPLLDAVKAVQ